MNKISIPLSDIGAAIKGLSLVVSDDVTRIHMEGIRLRFKGKSLELAATNGYAASIVNLACGDSWHGVSDSTSLELILPPDAIKAIKKIREKELIHYELVIESDCFFLMAPGVERRFPAEPSNFPDVDHAFRGPREDNEKTPYVLTFNAELLLDAAKSLSLASGLYKKGVVGTTLCVPIKKDAEGSIIVDRLAPIMLKSPNGEALVMPRRL